MDRADLLLARESLPLVSEIATELAAAIASRPLGAFGACLACFVAELPSSKHGLKDKQSLEEVLCKVLEEVERACIWPESRITPDFSTLRCLARSRSPTRNDPFWKTWFPSRKLHSNVRECLREYASSTAEFAKMLDVIKQTTTTRSENSSPEISKYSSVFAGEGEEAPDYPSRVNSELHDVLSHHVSFCTCQHLTRLRLNPRDFVQERGGICFEMLFSSQRNSIYPPIVTEWKETKMLVSSKNPRKLRPTFNDSATHTSIDSGLLSEERAMTIDPGHFCAVLHCSERTQLCFHIKHPQLSRADTRDALERKAKATESIPLSQAFRTRTMSRKTQCILAYTLAKSVWQYYGSEWMRYPWTRENIHILDDEPVRRDFSSTSYLFRPYFAVDFQKDLSDGISEYIDGEMLWHRYPQVLALGILLIEIAKGRPFEIPNIPLDYSRDSINQYLKSAVTVLEKESLFEKEGDDFGSYREAVEGCLKFGQFFDFPYIYGQHQPREKDKSLEERRVIIYRKVVQPLKELLKGTRWFVGIDEMNQDLDPGSIMARSNTSAISETRFTHDGKSRVDLGSLDCRTRLLHGKARMTSKSWLDELVSISETFPGPNGSQPIRIAVIDTGCDLAAPIFNTQGYEARLRGHWKDWVDESPQPRDEHGHGTEIVCLLLRILPNAEIFVARVARDQQDLNSAGGPIVKAIDHAAMIWTADIITMSFGFPRENPSIKKVIRKAEEYRDRSIIFFAAASNEGSSAEELFPANFDLVIPIRGTDCAGAFIPLYDPDVARSKRGMQLFGTLGEDVPWGWPDEDKLSSGCSVATPIAAGIAALIMQCVASTPGFDENDQRRIRTRRAILEVFHDMSVEKPMGRRYINPRNLLVQGGQPNVAMIQHVLSRIPR